jgi:hypothetical protein
MVMICMLAVDRIEGVARLKNGLLRCEVGAIVMVRCEGVRV